MFSFLNRLYGWYGRRAVHVAFVVIAVLVVLAFVVSGRAPENSEETTPVLRSVEVVKAGNLSKAGAIEIIGTVEAINEATLVSEAGGRIVRVSVGLGDSVVAGTILAEIENDSERATVLQAEGAYEAALARAAQSNTDVTSAEVNLSAVENVGIDAYRSAFTSAEDVIRNTVDLLFGNPRGQVPGFKLDALGDAVSLTNERKEIETILHTWSIKIAANVQPEDVKKLLSEAESDLLRLSRFVHTVSDVATHEENNDRTIGGYEITDIRSDLMAARTTIDRLYQSVKDKRSAVEKAEYALESAKISGTGSTISGANAAVKQALGTLRSAEAALSKTLIRAPFSGTVNMLSVKVGDATSPGTEIARVANNSALEITAFVNESERNLVSVGKEVVLEGTMSGMVTRIAPAIDPGTGKIEVRIGVDVAETIENGDTVTITLPSEDDAAGDRSSFMLPLRTIKMTPEGPVVFSVSENQMLVAHPIVIGVIMGDSVRVESGIPPEMNLVTDARGLKEGDTVTVSNTIK